MSKKEQFKAIVAHIDGVFYPRVAMEDGAIQWTGKYQYRRENAQRIAEIKAKEYNEA